MISDSKREVLRLFGEGRDLYKNRQFREAQMRFRDALAIDATDGPSKVFEARCGEYIKNPPPEGWDGVYTMTTK